MEGDPQFISSKIIFSSKEESTTVANLRIIIISKSNGNLWIVSANSRMSKSLFSSIRRSLSIISGISNISLTLRRQISKRLAKIKSLKSSEKASIKASIFLMKPFIIIKAIEANLFLLLLSVIPCSNNA